MDAFNLDDYFLNSVLGSYDGDVYVVRGVSYSLPPSRYLLSHSLTRSLTPSLTQSLFLCLYVRVWLYARAQAQRGTHTARQSESEKEREGETRAHAHTHELSPAPPDACALPSCAAAVYLGSAYSRRPRRRHSTPQWWDLALKRS